MAARILMHRNTETTMFAAIETVRVARPGAIVVVVPVAPDDTLEKIRAVRGVTEVACPEVPEDFSGVSQVYGDFTQVEDTVVVDVLKKSSSWGRC